MAILPAKDTPGGLYAFQWIAAWAVFLAILSLLNRTRVGHALIYHGVLLLILLLLAGQYRAFARIEEPLSGVAP